MDRSGNCARYRRSSPTTWSMPPTSAMLRTLTLFSYHLVDATNVRNIAAYGGGGLLDIGCYAVSVSRFIFAAEPARVTGIVELDPTFQTDRLASAILDFGSGTATFTCSTQLAGYQRVQILGTTGRI